MITDFKTFRKKQNYEWSNWVTIDHYNKQNQIIKRICWDKRTENPKRFLAYICRKNLKAGKIERKTIPKKYLAELTEAMI